MQLRWLRKIFFAVLVISLIFTTGYWSGYRGYQVDFQKFPKVTVDRNLPIDKSTIDFSIFWRVWDTLENSYFDKTKLSSVNLKIITLLSFA